MTHKSDQLQQVSHDEPRKIHRFSHDLDVVEL